MKTVSIIIPTLNAGPSFAAVLERLNRQKIDAAIEIIIFDSSSRDQTASLARQAGAHVELIPRANFNHGQTRNLAIARSSGDILIMLSQDALPAGDFLLANLCANFADPRVAGVFARHEARPDHGPLIQRHVQQWSGSLARHESAIVDRSAYDRLAPLERLTFCRFDNVCSALRRSVWQSHPFAARAFAEDLDWSRRVLEAGWKIVYDPAALVIHSHALSLRQHYRRVWQTHRALHQLFGLRLISHRRELPARLWVDMRHQFAIIHDSSLTFASKIRAFSSIPPRSLCTIAAIHRAAAAAEPRADQPQASSYENNTNPPLPIPARRIST